MRPPKRAAWAAAGAASNPAALSASGRVGLIDANADWPARFESERMKLAGMPGGGLRRIAHFGSTAVPGMRAKPIIDIMASVEALMEVDALFSPLGVLGYELVDVAFAKRRFFHKAPASHSIACHLHVVTDAVWRDKSELLFRDWLITHPSVARAYERLKEKLADEHPSDMPAYTAGKSEFVRAAVNDARRERGLPPSIDWIE